MTLVWTFKIEIIGVDEFFKQKAFRNETYLALKVNGQTEEPVDDDDIMEEARENPNKLDEEASVYSRYFPGKTFRSMTKPKNLIMLSR